MGKKKTFYFQDIKYKFKVAVLIEYIRSLNQCNIPVQVNIKLFTIFMLLNPLGLWLLMFNTTFNNISVMIN